jgi:ribonuclease E
VGHLSKFGLLELSRQRLRPTAEISAYTECPACHGRGRVKRVDTIGLSLLRQFSTQVAQNPIREVRVAVPLEVGTFLLNKKRKEIFDLETQFNLKIIITPNAGLGPEDIQVEYVKQEEPATKPASEEPAETKPAAEAKAKSRRSSAARRRGARKAAASKKAAAAAAQESDQAVEAPPEPPEPQETQESGETLVPHPEPHNPEPS